MMFSALMDAAPTIIKLLVFYVLFLTLFGIFGTKLLKGTYYRCKGLSVHETAKVIERSDCFDMGGDWINNDIHFDNILQAVSTLFQVGTSEGLLNLLE